MTYLQAKLVPEGKNNQKARAWPAEGRSNAVDCKESVGVGSLSEVSNGCSVGGTSKVVTVSDCETLISVIEGLVGTCRTNYMYTFKETSPTYQSKHYSQRGVEHRHEC